MTSKTLLTLVWFRQDLRLEDNPALQEATQTESPIIPLFIWDDEDPFAPGGALQWWLHHALVSLGDSLKAHGLSLVLRRGRPLEILKELVSDYDVGALYWNRCYEPYAIQRDRDIKAYFRSEITCDSFNASLLMEPWSLKTQTGGPYQVFTSYWNALQKQEIPRPLRQPIFEGHHKMTHRIASDKLEDWNLCPARPDWAKGFEEVWDPSIKGAQEGVKVFLEETIDRYHDARDIPGEEGVSRLSPYLHWGQVSIRRLWQEVREVTLEGQSKGAWTFLKELGWRDFAYHLLYHFPETPTKPLRSFWDKFEWEKNSEGLEKWQKGITGYPIVDAGMRQLWKTGWMHNRVRMIVASFLIKDMLIPWQKGAEWFWDTLVDADLANNSMNWQWVAGCGADASPYFRIFNPTLQGKKFDPQGEYVRRWVSELKEMPDAYVHEPWKASQSVLAHAGVTLGSTYPNPIVDHAKARGRALHRYHDMRGEDQEKRKKSKKEPESKEC